MTDAELLAGIREGRDADAFAEAVRRYLPLAYSAALRILGEAHLAEDAAQAAFLVLAKKARSLPKDAVLPGWIYAAAQLSALNMRRERARRERIEREAAAMRESEKRNEGTADEDLWRSVKPLLDNALAALPAPQRDAVVLRCLQQRSPGEVARELGCSEKAALMRVHRGLERLRRLFRRQRIDVSNAMLLGLISLHGLEAPPAALLEQTLNVCAGNAAASVGVLANTKGVVKTMFWNQMKVYAAAFLAVGVLGTAAFVAVKAEERGQTKKAHPATAEPAWLKGKPLNQWFAIPGTNTGLPGGSDAYCGWVFREDTCELFVIKSGGHSDGADNGVRSMKLSDDAPLWKVRTEPSKHPVQDVAFYPDRMPAATHTYSFQLWVPEVQRVMSFGQVYAFGSAITFPAVIGWDPVTNKYDDNGGPTVTPWPNTPDGQGAWNHDTATWGKKNTDANGGYGNVVARGANGEYWTRGWMRWKPGTTVGSGVYDEPIKKRPHQSAGDSFAWDSKRQQLFNVCWGNGQDDESSSSGGNLVAAVMRQKTLTLSVVTFKPSDALKQLQADKPGYTGLTYDSANDCFYFYDGRTFGFGGPGVTPVPNGPGKVYKIVPNESDVWEVSFYAYAPGSAPPPATGGGGINSRFTYVPALKGVVMMPSRDAGVYFLRTSQ